MLSEIKRAAIAEEQAESAVVTMTLDSKTFNKEWYVAQPNAKEYLNDRQKKQYETDMYDSDREKKILKVKLKE